MNAYFAEIVAADRMAEIRRELEVSRPAVAARPPSSAAGRVRVTRLIITIICVAFAAHQWLGA